MSTSDGFDLNAYDRGNRPADSPTGQTGRNRPAAPSSWFNQKLISCGCFGCSSFVIFAGCVSLLLLVWGFLLPDWRINHRYVATSCVVLEKKLIDETFNVGKPQGQGPEKQKSYRPQIKIRYEVSGRKFEPWAYDESGVYSIDRASQQAILDSFEVGATCPCWYDPDDPQKAVLVRGHMWGAYIALIVPLGLMVIGGAGIWMAKALAASRPAPVFSAGAPPADSWQFRAQQALTAPARSFDPSQFNDPLALKTDWTAMSAGGGNFQTQRLVEVDSERLAYRATWGGILFSLAFLLGGLAGFVGVLVVMVSNILRGNLDLSNAIVIPIALIFAAIGAFMLNWFTTPIVFDSQKGLFWKGRREPDVGFGGDLPDKATEFKAIHALQLLQTRDTERSGHELNLVLVDGERVNVVVYPSNYRKQTRDEAATIARFLNKPLWDGL